MPSAEWDAFVVLANECAPGVLTRFEDGRRRYQQEVVEEEEKRQQRQARDPDRRPLADRIEEILSRTGLSDRDRMLGLSWLCFDHLPRRNDPGHVWIDLPGALRGRVLDRCLEGLVESEPTPIPDTGPFPGAVLAEGRAFAYTVTSPEHLERVTDQMVRRWLPTALFARMSGDWGGPITACSTISLAATEAALLATIRIYARRDAPIVLRQIPSAFWTAAMTDRLTELILDEQIPLLARRELLGLLAVQAPARSEPLVREWAARPVSSAPDDPLRQAARNLLLAKDPDAALALIESDFAVRGKAVLEELTALAEHADGLPVRWEEWPLPQWERFGTMLLRAYPPTGEPEFENGFVSMDQELKWLRDRLVGELLTRSESEAASILDRLATLDPVVRARVDTHRANTRAAQLLPDIDPTARRDPAAFEVRDAVRLMDRSGFRLIRSPDDLLDAVLEALRAIDGAAGHDLPMLYSAPVRGKNREVSAETSRKHLEEDALQAYLRRRLLDELTTLADGITIQILREDEISRRQRLDLRVTAPCQGTRRLATVVIEVKWSTNEETNSGLVEQLGARYLLGEGLTHGVFVVGWSGQWFPRDRTGANTNLTRLVDHLTNQRDGYCVSGQPGEGLRIAPVILDLRWSRTGR